MWRGWTKAADADAYEAYLKNDLFPRVEKELRDHGYRGSQVLRLGRASEEEFVTMLWFESLDSVKQFAGDQYYVPVISERARSLLSHYDEKCEHYGVAAASFPAPK